MTIKGVGPGGTPQPDRLRSENAGQIQRAQHPGESAVRRGAEVGDTVELSSAALEGARTEAIPGGELEPARLREISRRIADGSYDSEAVMQRVADQILNEWNGQ